MSLQFPTGKTARRLTPAGALKEEMDGKLEKHLEGFGRKKRPMSGVMEGGTRSRETWNEEFWVGGAWVAPSVGHPTPDFCRAHDLRVVGSSPLSGSSLGMEPVEILSLPSAPPFPPCMLPLSVS